MRPKIQSAVSLCRSIGLTVLWTSLIASPSLAQGTPAASPSGTAILHPAETVKILPGAVFFRGQSASVQIRNSGGLKFQDGMLLLGALVDNAGYSSGLQEKYQGYFITEVPLDIQGRRLPPGAYGVGFLHGSRFIVMDLGGHDLFTVSGVRDAGLKRPVPFQILADSSAGHYRLYFGRNYVVLARAEGR